MANHKYKLTYFAGRGRGEAIRYIFAYAGVPYEDERIQFPDWGALKAKTPFGILPVLEVDGKDTLSQHVAVAHYLAKSFNIAGKTPLEEAKADQFVQGTTDIYPAFAPVIQQILAGNQEGKATAYATFKEGALKTYLDRYEGFLKANGTGHFVGNALTWADLYIAELLERLEKIFDPHALEHHPTLKKLVTDVHANPNIAKYVATRPATPL